MARRIGGGTCFATGAEEGKEADRAFEDEKGSLVSVRAFFVRSAKFITMDSLVYILFLFFVFGCIYSLGSSGWVWGVTTLRFEVYSVAYLYDMILERGCGIGLADELKRTLTLVGVLAETRQGPKKSSHFYTFGYEFCV